MLARRIIAVSSDKAFGKQLAIALKAAGGAVDLHASIAELGTGPLGAALLVVHVAEEAATILAAVIARLSGEAKAIAIIARSNLATVVEIMQASERVAGLLVAEELDIRQLSAMATRVLAGDVFGLDKLIRWGTQIHSQLVGDYQEKSLCIAQISEFAETMGVRRKYRESIDQCLDEMLMNALYDAPVDEDGKQIFSDIPTKTRISLRVEQKVVVQYACDGKQFAVSVRDAFGTLDRSTVLRYLHKCLHNEQQIDRKAGGAGLGLYLMTNASSEVYFNVLPGIATEAICVFDLEQPKLQLESFGFFHERIDASGRLASGPSRRLPAGAGHPVERRTDVRAVPAEVGRGVIALLVGMIVVVLALIVVAMRSSETVAPIVMLETRPTGAMVALDGRPLGQTPLTVTTLVPGAVASITFQKPGYLDMHALVEVPGPGKETRLIQPLAVSDELSLVKIESEPSGAQLVHDGLLVPNITTPAELLVEAGKSHRFVVTMPGKIPVTIDPFTPGRGAVLRSVKLVDAVVEAKP